MSRRALKVLAKKKGRARLSNGHALPRSVDHRSAWARRFRDLLQLHLSDLGGADNVSEAERAIVRRAATLILSLEMMEVKFAIAGAAEPHDLEVYQRCSSTMRRLLESIGLKRRQKEVMGLGELLRQDHEQQVLEDRRKRERHPQDARA